ncbi:MAG TPA: patatin-like phospholipase family protein [Rectinemataceae bacterium]
MAVSKKARLDKGWCLVLSGGGTKGVYHIGVWTALKELGIQVDGCVGTSIGAILGAIFCQGADEGLEELVEGMGIDAILALPKEFEGGEGIKLDGSVLSAAPSLLKSVVEKGGLDTSPLRQLLESRLDEDAIRRSGKDFGVVAVNLSDLKPKEIFIDAMEKGSLIDYIMASAAFPGFQNPVIGGKRYLDGGIYDNIPYAMARKRGYRRLIVSDMSGAGRNRRPEIEGSLTVYIKNSIEMGGIFDFDPAFFHKFSRLGYLDTMRTFGRYEGYDYFIEPDPDAEAEAAKADIPALAADETRRLPDRMAYDPRRLLCRLECAASMLEVDRLRPYSYAQLDAAIRAKAEAEESLLASPGLGEGQSLPARISALRKAVSERKFDRCPFHYWMLAGQILPRRTARVVRKALEGIFPALPVGLDYLKSIVSMDPQRATRRKV